MGYIPIFLYLAGFVFLFVIVVANSFKSKKLQYLNSFEKLVVELQKFSHSTEQAVPFEKHRLEEVEKYYLSLKANAGQESLAILNQRIKPCLAQAKLYLYWYNKMVQTRPYSFVAKIIGHSPI
jgi:hypothetical protein